MLTNVPDGPRKLAFRAFVRELQANPLLANSRVIKTWMVWDGKSPIATPTVDQMPAIQLKMLSGPIERIAQDGDSGLPNSITIRTSPTVAIDLWTAGTDSGDLMNIYDLIDSVFFPLDDDAMLATQTRMWAAGIMDWQPSLDVLPGSVNDYTADSIHGSGTYTLTLVLSQ